MIYVYSFFKCHNAIVYKPIILCCYGKYSVKSTLITKLGDYKSIIWADSEDLSSCPQCWETRTETKYFQLHVTKSLLAISMVGKDTKDQYTNTSASNWWHRLIQTLVHWWLSSIIDVIYDAFTLSYLHFMYEQTTHEFSASCIDQHYNI